jgi:outer membrane protein
VKIQTFTWTLAWTCLIAGTAWAQGQPSAAAPSVMTPGQAPAPAPVAAHPIKVGVIEIQNAILGTKDGQKATQEFAQRFDPRKKELTRKAEEIKDLQDKLQRGGAAMADAAKQELQRSIDVKTKSYNRDMEDANAEFQAEQSKVLDDLGQRMMQVIEKYAQANGYAVIIDVSNPQTPVMYASSAANITKDIVELYDKSLPANAPTSGGAKPGVTPMTSPTKPASTPATTPATKKQP